LAYKRRSGVIAHPTSFEGRFAVVHPCFWGIAEKRKDGSVTLNVTHWFNDVVKMPR